MSESLRRSVAAAVKAARKRAGLTQDGLAALIGRSGESVSNIERAQALPGLDTLAEISTALRVPLPELLQAVWEAPDETPRQALERDLRTAATKLDDERLHIALALVRTLADFGPTPRSSGEVTSAGSTSS